MKRVNSERDPPPAAQHQQIQVIKHRPRTIYFILFFLFLLFRIREEVRRLSLTLERILTDVCGARPTMARSQHAKISAVRFSKTNADFTMYRAQLGLSWLGCRRREINPGRYLSWGAMRLNSSA